jgi:hypothetical protein
VLDVVVESDVERARLLLESKEITARAAARENGSGDAAEIEAAMQDAVRTQEVQHILVCYVQIKVYTACMLCSVHTSTFNNTYAFLSCCHCLRCKTVYTQYAELLLRTARTSALVVSCS